MKWLYRVMMHRYFGRCYVILIDGDGEANIRLVRKFGDIRLVERYSHTRLVRIVEDGTVMYGSYVKQWLPLLGHPFKDVG